MGCTESSENSTDGEEVPKMEYASTCSIPTDFVKLPLLRKVIRQMYIYIFVAFPCDHIHRWHFFIAALQEPYNHNATMFTFGTRALGHSSIGHFPDSLFIHLPTHTQKCITFFTLFTSGSTKTAICYLIKIVVVNREIPLAVSARLGFHWCVSYNASFFIPPWNAKCCGCGFAAFAATPEGKPLALPTCGCVLLRGGKGADDAPAVRPYTPCVQTTDGKYSYNV